MCVEGGWFGGTVFRAAVGVVAKKKMPNATHMVEFKRPDVPKGVGGQVAGGAVDGELPYGATAAWLLLAGRRCELKLGQFLTEY